MIIPQQQQFGRSKCGECMKEVREIGGCGGWGDCFSKCGCGGFRGFSGLGAAVGMPIAKLIGCPTKDEAAAQHISMPFHCYWIKRPMGLLILGIGAVAIFAALKK